MAWAYADTGDLDRAGKTVKRAIDQATELRDRVVLSDALWTAGMVATQQGRWEEAERHFQEGIALTRSIEAAWPQSRTLYHYGLFLATKGEPYQACQAMKEALSIFTRLGSRPYIERAEDQLRALESPRPPVR
jgi:tetratricopeptide (TPR) repeat protein